jgi:Arc/MetJ family transcription regulator
MLAHMRTTIDIPDAILTRARERAHAEGTTLRGVVTEALRSALDEPPGSRVEEFELPTYGGNGLAAGVREHDLFTREERDLTSSWPQRPTAAR